MALSVLCNIVSKQNISACKGFMVVIKGFMLVIFFNNILYILIHQKNFQINPFTKEDKWRQHLDFWFCVSSHPDNIKSGIGMTPPTPLLSPHCFALVTFELWMLSQFWNL